MRPSLLLAVLLLANGVVFAQARPPVSRPDSAVARPRVPDTLAAIHRLFAQRRRQQTAGGLGIVAAAAVSIALVQTSSSVSDKNSASLGIGILAVPVLAIELFAFDSFNLKNERLETKDFVAHKPSKWLKRRLKPRFFQ